MAATPQSYSGISQPDDVVDMSDEAEAERYIERHGLGDTEDDNAAFNFLRNAPL